MKRIKTLIREYVTDHYHHFGFYPADVEVDDVLYSYEHYMYIPVSYTHLTLPTTRYV